MIDGAKHVRRPTLIEAAVWEGDNLEHMQEYTKGRFRLLPEPDVEGRDAEVFDHLHGRWINVGLGDAVAPGPQGEFYPIQKHTYKDLYRKTSYPAKVQALIDQFMADLAVINEGIDPIALNVARERNEDQREGDNEDLANLLERLAEGDDVQLEEFSDNGEPATQADRLAARLHDLAGKVKKGEL